MRRCSRYVPAARIALGLEPTADPASEAALRAAYRRLELSRRLAFEQALSDRAHAIGIRNLAEATARRINRPARGRKAH
jgi:hypothetical protein